MALMASPYGAPVQLGRPALPRATVTASISERGTIRIQQDGNTVLLTPGELRELMTLAGG